MFPQIHDYFQLLQFCAVHIFWKSSGNHHLQQKIAEFSWISPEIVLPLLQTNFTEIKEIDSFRFKKYNFTRTQVDLNFISQIYYKVFNSTKYNQKCIIELPVLNKLETNDLEDYLSMIFMYHGNRKHKKTLYSVDYVIFGIYLANQTKSEVSIRTEYRQRNSKIILLSQHDNKIFEPCLPSSMDCWVNGKLRWNLVQKFIPFTNRRSLWNELFQGHAPLKNWQDELSKRWDPNISCHHTKKDLKHTTHLKSYHNNDCVKLLIAASINCTSTLCRGILQNDYNAEILLPGMQYYFSPFGAQFHGYRLL